MKPGYYVNTWDINKTAWTPQQGVRTGPWSKWGLRRAIRGLRACGYPCTYRSIDAMGDPSVSIEHYDAADVKILNERRKAGVGCAAAGGGA